MNTLTSRALRVGAAAGSLAAALVMLSAGPASAAPGDANSTAFGISATALAGVVNVGPTPTSTYPPGANNSVATVNLGALGSTGVVNATTAGTTNGTSSATGSAADVALLAAVPGLPAITATLISASCTDNGTTTTGSSTFTGATLGTTAITANPAPNTVLLNAAGVTVTLNQQTTAGGKLTVNALHAVVVLLGVTTADIIIGQATCGPNTPVLGSPIFTPLYSVGLGAIAIGGFGFYLLRRRTAGPQR